MSKFVATLSLLVLGVVEVNSFAAGDGQGQNQYRAEQPQVLRQAELASPSVPDSKIGEFGRAYVRAGQPRIAFYWDAEVNDVLRDKVVKVERKQEGTKTSASSSAESTAGEAGSAKLEDRQRETVVNSVKQETTERADGNTKRAPTLGERDRWNVEAAIVSRLRGIGVRLVDRSLMLRSQAVRETDENSKAIEIKALSGKADYLMEVMATADSASALGTGFRISVKSISTGEVRLLTYIAPIGVAKGQARVSYRAGKAGGFEKVVDSPTATFEDVIDNFMDKLSEAVVAQRLWG